MTWTEKRVIVVGGAGFVGSNLCRKLLETDVAEILVIDNLLSAERENIPESKRIIFWEGSIADDAVLKKLMMNMTTYSTWQPITAIRVPSMTHLQIMTIIC